MAETDWLLVTDWFAGRPITWGALRLYRHFGREHGTTTLALRVLELTDDNSPAWRSDGAEEFLYGVVGTGAMFIGGHRCPFAPGTALHVPAGASVVPRPRGSTRLVSVLCPDPGPDPGFLFEDPDDDGAPPTVARLDDAVREPEGAGTRRSLLATPAATVALRTLPPGTHALPADGELAAVVLSGGGRVSCGERTVALFPGSCAVLPPGPRREVSHDGPAMLQLLCVRARVG